MLKQIVSSIIILGFLSFSTACGWISDVIEEEGNRLAGDQFPDIELESELTQPGNTFQVPLDSGGTVTATVSDADEDGYGEGLSINGNNIPNILYGNLDALKPGSLKSGARAGEKFVTVKLVGDESIITAVLGTNDIVNFYELSGISNEFYILITLDTSETTVEEIVNLEFYDNPNFNGEPYEFISTPVSQTELRIDGFGRGGVVEVPFINISVIVED